MARPWIGKSRRRVTIKNHAFLPDGVYTLARVIVAERLGRALTRLELVHHCDHDETNDDPKNLRLITSRGHSAIHLKGKHRSEETKRKISQTQTGIPKHEGHGEAVRRALTGKKWTPQRKANHRVAMKEHFKRNPKPKPTGEPWVKLGISRKTWYRHQRKEASKCTP